MLIESSELHWIQRHSKWFKPVETGCRAPYLWKRLITKYADYFRLIYVIWNVLAKIRTPFYLPLFPRSISIFGTHLFVSNQQHFEWIRISICKTYLKQITRENNLQNRQRIIFQWYSLVVCLRVLVCVMPFLNSA